VQKFVNYGCKRFYNTGLFNVIKLFMTVFYEFSW
jgi:hypothetical protein